jgi:hypothetical protein
LQRINVENDHEVWPRFAPHTEQTANKKSMNPPNNFANGAQKNIGAPPLIASPFGGNFTTPFMATPMVQPTTPTVNTTTPPPVETAPPSTSGDIFKADTSKHKRVYFDPEGQSSISNELKPANTTATQLTNNFGQMNLSANSNQPMPSIPAPQPSTVVKQTPGPSPIASQTITPKPVPYTATVPVANVPSEALQYSALQQCPPLFMRQTINVCPQTTDLLNKSNLLFGSVIHPMAKPITTTVILSVCINQC